MATIKGTKAKNILTGTAGADNIFGLAGNDTLFGLKGNDKLFGGAGNDKLFGGAGSDTLDGGTGHDVLNGGNGNDRFIVDDALDQVVEAAGQGVDLVTSRVTFTLAANVENLILSGAKAINGTGNALSNAITGNAADNILDGGAGADTLIGGDGNDTYVVDNAGDTVADTSGFETVQSSVNFVLGAGFENLTLTGASAINGTGNALNNAIAGNAADNILDGGTGADTLIGGDGNDTYVVDNAGDTVADTSGFETVQSSVNFVISAGLENLTLTGASAVNGTGNSGNNVISGNSADNVLDGGLGNDTLSGGAGNDILIGGAGDDTFLTGVGADTVVGGLNTAFNSAAFNATGLVNGDWLSYADATSGVTVDLSKSGLGTGGAAGDVWSGIENLQGSNFNDTLTADNFASGFYEVFGGAGNDTISSGNGTAFVFIRGDAGTDVLIGNAAHSDGFMIQYGQGFDSILEFVGSDLLVVSKSAFNLAGNVGFNPGAAEFANKASASFVGANERLIFETDTHILWADRDGSGSAFAAEAIAVIQGAAGGAIASLSAGDFFIIA